MEVLEQSHVAALRRYAASLAKTAGLDENHTGRVSLVATEIATNLLKHGSGGNVAVQTYRDGSGSGIELVALDKGDGIANIPLALTDGFSTAGTVGGGLGIMQRQADLLTLFSRPGMGTVLVTRFAAAPGTPKAPLIGAMVDPYPGETVSGDAWSVAASPAGETAILVDGSGHGSAAREAAAAALEVFDANADQPLTRLMELIHRAMFATRGGAVGLARIDGKAKLVRFVGVGNITAATVANGEVKRMVSHNGTAGMLSPRMHEFTYPYNGVPTVVMHSDGLTAKWDLGAYPGGTTAHPCVIAGILFRDFRRGRDDASVLVMRLAS